MKRTISILLSLLMLLSSTPLSGLIAFANEGDASGQVDENISWSFDAATKTLTFTGEGWVGISHFSDPIKRQMVPDDVENLVFADGITGCSAHFSTFSDLRYLKTVTYGNTFYGFQSDTFLGDSSIEAIYVDEGNPDYYSVDGVLYNKNMDVLIRYPAAKSGSVVILPESVVNIGAWAFANNIYAKYIEFDSKVKELSPSAFRSCQSLKYVEIPEKITSIPEFCFFGCKELSEVFIPKTVNTIGKRAFSRCSTLGTIKVDSENESYVSSSNVLYTSDYKTLVQFPSSKQTYTINNNTTRIAEEAFAYNTDIEKVVLPEGLEYIELQAFYNCTSLKEITKSNSLISIGDSALRGCTSLETFEFPDTIQSVREYAFYNSGIRRITLPRTLGGLPAYAFGNLDMVTILNPDFLFPGRGFEASVIKGYYNSTAQKYAAQVGSDFVCLCTDGTENHDYEETVVEPTSEEKGYTLYTCKTCGYNYKSNVIKADEIVYTNGGRTLVSYSPELTDDTFVVPDTVNVISDDAFNNEYLKTVVVSSNVKVIGNSAFENCPNLESVEFSDDAQLEQIESSAFAGTNIQTVVVPESVKSVKSKAFANCIKLDSFDVEENVEEIADDAFENSNNVTLICPYQSASYKFASRKKIPTIAYSRIPDQKYTGKPICPEVAIYDVNGNRMYNGMDFYFTYKNNINVGTAYTVVNGIGAYNGRVKNLKFKIVKAAAKPSPVSASTLKVSLARTSYTYDGGAKKPNVIVKTKAGKTVSSSNYTASYSGARKNVGAYTVTIKFKNSYTGTVKRTFRIYPKATYITKLVAGKKSFTAKWNKQTAQVTGYQVQYCVRSNFKGAKTVTVGSAKTASKKIAKVAGNKKYYVRVRTYKTVGKTRYYSSWSKAKAVKTK